MDIDSAIHSSFWREAYQDSLYPQLTANLEVDVAIVGGGITGLTAAYLLTQAGMKVVVLEKDTVGGGTTGRTTGKVTSQHDLIYDEFYRKLGPETAKVYGEANQAALQKVAEIIRKEKIDCDWQQDDNYVYTTDEKQVEKFKREAQIAQKIGLPATYEENVPLLFPVKAAVKFSDQGKFHAQNYVLGLARAITEQGNEVFEYSKVVSIQDGDYVRVATAEGEVKAKHAIVATNVPTLPLAARGAYCMLEYPTESYIVAGKYPKDLSGMYISPDNENYSILPFMHDGERYLLVGGEGHISGMRVNRESKFAKLAGYAHDKLGLEKIEYKWSDRDYLTYDGPPLAGHLYPWSKNLYVASAFRKWGLTNGTASAMIITDLICNKQNPWAHVYDPNRIRPILEIPRVAVRRLLKF